MSEVEITLKEVEVNKLNVKSGDTLVLTVKGYELTDQMPEIAKAFREKFKDKGVEVILMQIPEETDISFSVVKKDSTPAPAPYCAGCDCGKKERFEKG